MKALRVFYNKAGEIIWTSSLEGVGEFPRTIKEELKELPRGTGGLEVTDPKVIAGFMASDDNLVKDGELVIGPPRPEVPEVPERDLEAELDRLIEWAKGMGYE